MAENTINFTKAKIDGLPLPDKGKRDTYKDAKAEGLQLRVASSGAKTFSVYRWVKSDQKPERITLGRYPALSIEKARQQAAGINAAIAEGRNPNEPVRDGRNEMTLQELFNLYLERWARPNKKTWREDVSQFEQYCKRQSNLSKQKLSRISKGQIASLHAEISKDTPIRANRFVSFMRSLFNWANDQSLWNKDNPAKGIRKNPEKSRERFIQSEELPLFFESLALDSSELLQDYFMLLLLTGVRRSNLMAMRWEEISFERKEWRIPDTKNGTSQTVALDDGQGAIMRILGNLKSRSTRSPWVFPGSGASGHLVEPRKGWERILARTELLQIIGLLAEQKDWSADDIQKRKLDAVRDGLTRSLRRYRQDATDLGIDISMAGLRDLRIHDLRRTLGSWMAGTGASTVMIGKQLNQKAPAATAIYARLQLDPVKEARNKAVSAMFGAAGFGESADIAPIKSTQKAV